MTHRKPTRRGQAFRDEDDSMGTIKVPAKAYYGAGTQRAVENFPISSARLPPSFIRAIALIKLFAAQVNAELKLLDERKAKAIARAAREVSEGKFDKQFVVDVFQTGSGTSTNMNANEVIAGRARELMGHHRAARGVVHPNDDVNMGQSSNDVFPSATHVAVMIELNERLLPALARLHQALLVKSSHFREVIKTGRTHLNDATPLTLGQEFSGYAGQVERAIERIRQAQQHLGAIALGGTAVGTGVNTHGQFAQRVCTKLSAELRLDITETRNHFQAQSTVDELVETSGTLRTLAASLIKIANDIRWLSSGPRAGLGELKLPEVQPGSSIMPGKVNPVISESLIMVATQVIGYDTAITLAGQSGSLELNTMQPLVAFNLLDGINLLTSAVENFRTRCVEGIEATERGPLLVETGLMLATALAPRIGYEAAALIAKEAAVSGESIRTVALRKGVLPEAELDDVLDPFRMARPHEPDDEE